MESNFEQIYKKVLLTTREKKAVINYYNECEKIDPFLNKTQICKRASKVFSISAAQVYKILRQAQDGEMLKDASKGGRQKMKNSDDYYLHYLKTELSKKIYEYHNKNEHFTLSDLLNFAKEDLEFSWGRTKLYKILKLMGYTYKKCNNRKILSEQAHVKAKSVAFLKKYLQYLELEEKVTFIYLDESWIYQNGSAVRMWINEKDVKANPKKVKNEGNRFTVLHAGCCLGWIDGCSLLLDSKIEHRDYHKTMDGTVFKKWVESQLIPGLRNIPGKCIVVMDNAPYHSVQSKKAPTRSSLKQEMQHWLKENNIRYEEQYTKKQLWEIIQPLLIHYEKKYVIHTLLNNNGNDVLRLPPYQCQYNPIELAWAFLKDYHNKHIPSRTSTKVNVYNLWNEAISHFTPAMWTNSIAHCEKLIRDDWSKYMGDLGVKDIPPIIISLGEDSDASNSDFGFSDESDHSDQ